MSQQTAASGLLHITNYNYRNFVLPVFVFFGLLHLFVPVMNHYCFRTVAFDYSVYNFAFYDFAHFRVSPCTLYYSSYEPVTFMQDHFSLLLIFLSPLYWLLGWLTGTYTLIIIQWAFICAGAWCTYRLILAKSSDYSIGLLAMVYYFLLYGRWTACDADCNLAIMGSALIPVLLYYFETGQLRALIVCYAISVLAREDYSIWLAFIFLCLMVVHRKDKIKRKWAGSFLLASLVFMLLIFKVFIPAFENQYKHYDFFEFKVIGKTPGEAVLFMLQHPVKSLELLFINHSGNPIYDHVKRHFYLVYLVSGGFFLFYRPAYLIAFLPLIAKKMYSDAPVRWGIASYYSVEVVSLLPVAVFMILVGLRNTRVRSILAVSVCVLTLGTTLQTFSYEQRDLEMQGVNKHDFLRAEFYKSLYDQEQVNEAIRSLPADAGVSASSHLTTHMALREKIYYFPRVDDAEYIFLFKHHDFYYLSEEEYNRWVAGLRADTDWKLIREEADFVIFHRPKK